MTHRISQAIVAAFVFLTGAVLCVQPVSIARGQAEEIFHVGFTSRLFGGVNENDAMAAVQAWAQAFVKERKLPVVPQTPEGIGSFKGAEKNKIRKR